MTLGERLRHARLQKGLSYRKLGAAAQVDHTWLYKIEKGTHQNLTVLAAKRLARVLGVTVDYLAGMYDTEEDEEPCPRPAAPVPASR